MKKLLLIFMLSSFGALICADSNAFTDGAGKRRGENNSTSTSQYESFRLDIYKLKRNIIEASGIANALTLTFRGSGVEYPDSQAENSENFWYNFKIKNDHPNYRMYSQALLHCSDLAKEAEKEQFQITGKSSYVLMEVAGLEKDPNNLYSNQISTVINKDNLKASIKCQLIQSEEN